MKLEVLRNGGYKDDSASAATTSDLLDDIGIWLNNRYKTLRKMNLWPELRLESYVTVPANTNEFDKPSDLKTIISIRNGTTTLWPVDSTQITLQNPGLWDYEGEPNQFVQQGENGIRLLGQYDTATRLDLFGKACVDELINAGDCPSIDVDDIIIAGATADLYSIARPIQSQAQYWNGVYSNLLGIGIAECRGQQADDSCLKPQNPWTAGVAYMGGDCDGTNYRVPTN